MGRFYLKDGRTLDNAADLAAAMERMDHKTFIYHVNSKKNDFASWLEWMGESEAARELMNARSKTDAELRLLRLILQKEVMSKNTGSGGGDKFGKRDNP